MLKNYIFSEILFFKTLSNKDSVLRTKIQKRNKKNQVNIVLFKGIFLDLIQTFSFQQPPKISNRNTRPYSNKIKTLFPIQKKIMQNNAHIVLAFSQVAPQT